MTAYKQYFVRSYEEAKAGIALARADANPDNLWIFHRPEWRVMTDEEFDRLYSSQTEADNWLFKEDGVNLTKYVQIPKLPSIGDLLDMQAPPNWDWNMRWAEVFNDYVKNGRKRFWGCFGYRDIFEAGPMALDGSLPNDNRKGQMDRRIREREAAEAKQEQEARMMQKAADKLSANIVLNDMERKLVKVVWPLAGVIAVYYVLLNFMG